MVRITKAHNTMLVYMPGIFKNGIGSLTGSLTIKFIGDNVSGLSKIQAKRDLRSKPIR